MARYLTYLVRSAQKVAPPRRGIDRSPKVLTARVSGTLGPVNCAHHVPTSSAVPDVPWGCLLHRLTVAPGRHSAGVERIQCEE